MIKLGSRVRDSINGWQGIVVARTERLHSTPTVCVEAEELCESKVMESEWIDEDRLIVVEENPVFKEWKDKEIGFRGCGANAWIDDCIREYDR